jgi:hypothetical protein
MSKKKTKQSEEDKKFPLPVYKKEDDIYNQEKEEALDDDGTAIKKGTHNESGPGDDLDIPGAELDDTDEAIGEEDEENNYYSLGGDDHNDLEEDRD